MLDRKLKRYLLILLIPVACLVLAANVLAGEKTNPFAGDKAAIAAGQEIFDEYCTECHGTGTGGSGPDLTDAQWIYGGSDAEIFATVSNGRQGGMPSFSGEIEDEQIWKVITFVRSLKK